MRGADAPHAARSRRPPPETTPATRPHWGGVWAGTLPEHANRDAAAGCDRQPDGQTGQNRPATAAARGGVIGFRSGPRPPQSIRRSYINPSLGFLKISGITSVGHLSLWGDESGLLSESVKRLRGPLLRVFLLPRRRHQRSWCRRGRLPWPFLGRAFLPLTRTWKSGIA